MATFLRRAVPLAALFLLNASLTFYDDWPTPNVQWYGHLSAELAAAVLLLAVIVRRGLGQTTPRTSWTLRAVSAMWVALVVGRYFDVMAPALYGRPINLYWDLRHMSAVAAMMTDAVAGPLVAAGALGVGLVLWLLYLGVRRAFAVVIATLGTAPGQRLLPAASIAVLLIFAVQTTAGEPVPPFTVAPPVSATYWHQVRLAADQIADAGTAPSLPQPVIAGDLAGVRGADVLLVFVESYGAVTLDRPVVAAPLVASRNRFEEDARATGRRMVSAMVDSPTFGGGSWLAHVSLMTGVEARDERTNQALMSQHRATMVSAFAQAGYRTVALMPGLRHAWPEGAFYGFDTIYGESALGYTGPRFGWWVVPDQFALARFDALEAARKTDRPLFMFFPTTSTHAPFGPIAPYQPDWPQLISPHPYAEPELSAALAREPDYLDLAPSYVNAMAYSLATLGGYLRQHPNRDLVLVVVGDHQPAAVVAGEGASWDVPVHVVASRDEVLDALLARGFRGGVTPGRRSLGPMHGLLSTLLESFGGPPVRVAAR
jgi:hypothetical protein